MTVEVVDESGESGEPVDVEALARAADFVLGRLGIHPDAELSVRLVDEDEMAALHERWMDEPGPTDVLSFPMDELRPPAPGEPAPVGVLGDVVLCPQVAGRQGRAAGHGRDAELELLLTHGVLHLLGHDHAERSEHDRMFALQGELLAAWQEQRAGRPGR